MATRNKADYTEESPSSPSLLSTVASVGRKAATAISDGVKTLREEAEKMQSKVDTTLSNATTPFILSDTDTPKEEKKVVTGTDPDNPFEALQDLDKWNENVLHGVRQPTYYVRMFMTEDRPFQYGKFTSYADLVEDIKSRKQTTIMETGTTGLNITGISIRSFPGPNPLHHSVSSTSIEMRVKEPMGTNLMDMLAHAARELRVKNYAKTYYFIEIRFQGYTEDGQYEINPCSEFPNGGLWLYKVALNDIESELTAEGSSYVLRFRPYEETMLYGDATILPYTANPEGSTVGEMLNGLAESLTKSYADMYADDTFKVFEFRFVEIEHNGKTINPANFAVSPTTSEQTDSMRSISMSDVNGKIRGHFARGVKLTDIVELVMANSEAAQQLGKTVSIQHQLDDDKTNIEDCIIFRVIPSVEIGDYDFISESYKTKHILTVVPYQTQEPVITHEQIVVANDPQAQARNVRRLRESGFLCKAYDYLFTGMSSDITNLDIRLNTAWGAIVPRVIGQGNTTEYETVNALYTPKETADWLKKLQSEYQSKRAKYDDINHRKQELDDFEERVQSITDEEERKEQERKLKKAREDYEEDFKDTDVDALTKEVNEMRQHLNEAKAKFNLSEMDRYGTVSSDRDDILYGEELIANGSSADKLLPMPVTIRQSNSDPSFNVAGVMPDYKHRDRAIFGAIMDQLYMSGKGSLQDLTMEIIGDPYWLGVGNLEYSWWASVAPLLKNIASFRDEKGKFRTQITGGDIMFLLRFKYPQGYDEDTHNPVFTDNETFTGVYKITQIEHSLEGGIFRQVLHARRLPLINVYKAFGWRSETEKAKLVEKHIDSVKPEWGNDYNETTQFR